MRKKSYMNLKNIVKEGKLLDKIKGFFKKKKPNLTKLQKQFRSQPEIKKRIDYVNADAEEIAKWYKEKFGKDVPKDFFI